MALSLRVIVSMFAISFLLLNQFASAQMAKDMLQEAKIKLSGQVVDSDTGQGLEFATISIFSSVDSSLIGGELTDGAGYFSIEIQSQPSYAIIEFIGFITHVIDPLPLTANTEKRNLISLGIIKMSVNSLALEEVEVRAERSENQFSLDKRIFNVGKDLANRGGSAVDILDNVPSVTVDVEGAVSLRGSSGVRILINGKRSGLGDNLKNIPSNQIDRIEVITNPSARYDAEGMAGIINIVLKKDTRQGFNGSFDLSGGYPRQAGIGANVNYRKNKINWFAGYGFQIRESPGEAFQYTEIQRGDTTLITNQNRDMQRDGRSHTIRFGADYFFNQKTSLTGSFRYQDSEDDNFTLNTYDDYVNQYPGNPSSFSTRSDDEVENENELEYSLSFKKEFSSREHILSISVDYEDELEDEYSGFIETITPLGGQSETLVQRSNNDEGQKEWVAQADYIHPFTKDNKIEFGLKASLRDITNDFEVEENDGSKWFTLVDLTNNFIYNENIFAAYAQYGNKFDKLSYQVGLRYEYADITTELLQYNEINNRIQPNLFPSIFINYEFSEGDALQASYSRRIQRPGFWHLNPFFTYNDSRNIFAGNPNLNPEYTDSYEVQYLKFWEHATLNSGLFYRHSTGVIERIRTLSIDQDGREVTTIKPENLAERDDFGFEFTLSYSAISWLRLDASANFFRSITDGTNFGESFTNDTYTWTSRMTSRFTFWKGSDLQLRGNYRAPRETTQGKSKSMTSIDLGWSKDLLPKKDLTITLSVRDLFNSRKRRYETFGDNFQTRGDFQWRARSANLSFNYRINQKKKRNRPNREFEGGEGF